MGWARKATARPATTSGRSYPYKGLLSCKTCSFINITAYTKLKRLAKGQHTEYVFYTCTKKNKQLKCTEPQISSRTLEQEIKIKLKDYEITSADGLECNKWLEIHYRGHIVKKNKYRPIWQRDLDMALKALATLDQKLEDGVIADDRYKLRAAQHTATVARTKALLESLESDARQWLELAKEIFSSVTNIGEVFEVANEEERRQLMLAIGSNWHLSNKKVDLTPRRPIDLLRSSSDKTIWRA